MTFEEWFEQEGRVMVDGDCSHEVVARAAFFVASQHDHKSDAELSELRQQNAELRQQNAELTNWKQQATTVLNESDLQEIGKVLGVGLGESVGPHILPAIKKLTAELEDWWREAHDEACTNMEQLPTGRILKGGNGTFWNPSRHC